MKKLLILSAFLIFALTALSAELTLTSYKVDEGPKLDGLVDSLWNDVPGITVQVKVPSVFKGFRNPKEAALNENEYRYEVLLKSVYDGDYIYFLVQYPDDKMTIERMPWFFRNGKWQQGPKHPVFSESGELLYPSMYEDKFAFLWNINDSIEDFNDVGCAVVCHVPYKHTNSPDEFGDMWHFKYVRTGVVGQADDKNLVYSEKNGRKADVKTSGGYKDNVQVLNGVKVPLYWLPDESERYWIYSFEIRMGKAQKIVKIEGTDLIDEDGNVVPKDRVIPGIIVEPFNGGRGDVLTEARWDQGVWTLEFKRRLVTAKEPGNIDVQFEDLTKPYHFAVAVFDNAATEHAIHYGAIKFVFQRP